jgi:hypothetical protein
MKDKPNSGQAHSGASIVRRDPAPRTITTATVQHLKQGGASQDLVRYAEEHVQTTKK